nr:sel1 repeat family protein [Deltaproteobacteria bacterium]
MERSSPRLALGTLVALVAAAPRALAQDAGPRDPSTVLAAALDAGGAYVPTTCGTWYGCRGRCDDHPSIELCERGGMLADTGLPGMAIDNEAERVQRQQAAIAMYSRACELGSAVACYRAERNVPTTEAPRRLSLAERACAGGMQLSCLGVAELLSSARPNGVTPDLARARALLTTACDGGVAEACRAHARLLTEGRPGLTPDPAAALPSLRRACEPAGADVARLRRATSPDEAWRRVLDRSISTRTALERSVELDLSRSTLTTIAWACQSLGQALERGQGTTADPAAAHAAFERSCSVYRWPEVCAGAERLRPTSPRRGRR